MHLNLPCTVILAHSHPQLTRGGCQGWVEGHNQKSGLRTMRHHSYPKPNHMVFVSLDAIVKRIKIKKFVKYKYIKIVLQHNIELIFLWYLFVMIQLRREHNTIFSPLTPAIVLFNFRLLVISVGTLCSYNGNVFFHIKCKRSYQKVFKTSSHVGHKMREETCGFISHFLHRSLFSMQVQCFFCSGSYWLSMKY